jgi:hypothetical protein
MNRISIILGIIVILFSIADYFRLIDIKYCSITCAHNYDGIGFNWGLILITGFLFSVATDFYSYGMHRSWWIFSRIVIPVAIFLIWLISLGLQHNPGGFFNMDSFFDQLGFILIYTVFVIGSFVQIIREYRNK